MDDSIFGKWEMSKVLDEMDANGVERAILTANLKNPLASPLEFVEARPDRFALAVRRTWTCCGPCRLCASCNPSSPTIRLPPPRRPVVLGRRHVRADNAVYYPLYTKCCELDLPLCMNTGLPGPPIPGEVQNPIYYDRVCVRFPELKLCMIHGADPWWDTAIRLMIKYPNLHLMTSAWAPKYLPESLLHYMRTRGKQRSSSPPTRRCSRSPAPPARPASSTCRPRCSTTTSTANAQRFFFDRLEQRTEEPA